MNMTSVEIRELGEKIKRRNAKTFRRNLIIALTFIVISVLSVKALLGDFKFLLHQTKKINAKVINTQMHHIGRGFYMQTVTYQFKFEGEYYRNNYESGKILGQRSFGDIIEVEFSISEPDINEKTNKKAVWVEDVKCNLQGFFPKLELPIVLDAKKIEQLSSEKNKPAITLSCFSALNNEMVDGNPVKIQYSLGQAETTDGHVYYFVINQLNPEVSMDMAFISVNLFVLENGKLKEGFELAKYHYYSGVCEEHYSEIDTNGFVVQKIKHTGNNEGNIDVFLEKEVTFRLENIFKLN